MKKRFTVTGSALVAVLMLAGCEAPADNTPEPVDGRSSASESPGPYDDLMPTPVAPTGPTEPDMGPNPDPAHGDPAAPALPPEDGAYTAGTVASVVDGDTVKVDTPEGRLTVRLIGINTPETKHPKKGVECYGPEATSDANYLLYPGQPVIVDFDDTQERTDNYGRTLAYITMDNGQDYGFTMLAMGSAEEYTYKKHYEKRDMYLNAQESARSLLFGKWGMCPNG